jgi:hypothetical protein
MAGTFLGGFLAEGNAPVTFDQNGFNLPCDDASYDRIVSILIFHHMAEITRPRR